jgi:hypothetical protein
MPAEQPEVQGCPQFIRPRSGPRAKLALLPSSTGPFLGGLESRGIS